MSKLESRTLKWLADTGFTVRTPAMWTAALTHGSTGEHDNYERLEFLGDRVLGLSVAHWLYDAMAEPEGTLATRLNAMVSRQMCAEVARGIGVPEHVRVSKQADSDGGRDSDNILGDVMEALLSAQYLDNGFQAAFDLVHHLWRPALESGDGSRKHPKSALQEWAAGNQRKPPEYEVIGKSGPDHKKSFTVRVRVHKVGEAEGTASSKGAAEREAARAFMERYG
ncbi:ribonuclease III [Qipengyuania sp.]|uniref:ribonuclease III n=1 Tax=Qipengyuania sp. TaxID=2004515 RepID=UPI0035C847B4